MVNNRIIRHFLNKVNKNYCILQKQCYNIIR